MYPNLPDKHRHPSLTGPGDFLDAARAAGWDPGPLPAGVVFTFSPAITARLAERDDFEEQRALAPSNARFFATGEGAARIGVSCLAPGAAAMATQVQNLIHLGVRRFASVGTAGGLREELEPGQVVLVSRAVRDDGVSQHFVEPARYAEPDSALTERLGAELRAQGLEPLEGSTWTVAVPFRMTAPELEEYAGDGVLAVEMEVAALFGVAGALGAAAASALVLTDVTTTAGRIKEDWRAASEPLLLLVDAAIAALRG